MLFSYANLLNGNKIPPTRSYPKIFIETAKGDLFLFVQVCTNFLKLFSFVCFYRSINYVYVKTKCFDNMN